MFCITSCLTPRCSERLYHKRALFIKMIGRIDDNPLGGMTVCHVAQFRDHEAVAYLKVINREVGNLETDTMDTGHCSIFEFDDGKATLAMQAHWTTRTGQWDRDNSGQFGF